MNSISYFPILCNMLNAKLFVQIAIIHQVLNYKVYTNDNKYIVMTTSFYFLFANDVDNAEI